MKTKLPLLVLCLLFAGFATAALAQADSPITAAPTGSAAADSILTWLIPIIVPLIIAGCKKLLPGLPKVWLPILGPILGAAIDIVGQFTTGAAGNLWLAVGLGAAGVGLREIVDQVRKVKGSEGVGE